jgi:hypothetical protein
MTRAGYAPNAQLLGSVTIASGASTSSSLDLGTTAGWSRLAAGYAAAASTAAALSIQGSVDDSTYKNIHVLVPTSSTAQYQPLTIATAVSSTGVAVFQAPPFRYIRFLASATIDSGGIITVYGAD